MIQNKSDMQGQLLDIMDGLKVLKPSSPYWPQSANSYIFEDVEGLTLFDVGCGSISSVENLLWVIKRLAGDSVKITKIILSHAHPDHMGGIETLVPELKPESIIIHELDFPFALNPEKLQFSFDIPLCKKRLKEKGDIENYSDTPGSSGKKGASFDLLYYFNSVNCSMSSVKANSIVREGDNIQIGSYNFDVIHTPGHAPGHISLYERKKRFLLSGDILGDIVAWYSPSSGGVIGYLKSLEKIETLDLDFILPSHGDIISDPNKVIRKTRKELLKRDELILKSLKIRPKTFHELLKLFFDSPSVQFFPGTPILESHLQKLRIEGKIKSTNFQPKKFFLV